MIFVLVWMNNYFKVLLNIFVLYAFMITLNKHLSTFPQRDTYEE